MASTSRMLARNWLPRPSPFEAPRTRPAISTKVSRVGMICADSRNAPRACRAADRARRPRRRSARWCRTDSSPPAPPRSRVSALKNVDLPTLGSADDAAFETHQCISNLALRPLARASPAARSSSAVVAVRSPWPPCARCTLFWKLGSWPAREQLGALSAIDVAPALPPRPLVLGEIVQHIVHGTSSLTPG